MKKLFVLLIGLLLFASSVSAWYQYIPPTFGDADLPNNAELNSLEEPFAKKPAFTVYAEYSIRRAKGVENVSLAKTELV